MRYGTNVVPRYRFRHCDVVSWSSLSATSQRLSSARPNQSKPHPVLKRFAAHPSTTDLLDYCYLGQPGQLIMSNAAWKLFQSAFCDKRELESCSRSREHTLDPKQRCRFDRAAVRRSIPEPWCIQCEHIESRLRWISESVVSTHLAQATNPRGVRAREERCLAPCADQAAIPIS